MTDDGYRWTPPGLSADQTRDFLSARDGIPAGSQQLVLDWLTDNARDDFSVDTSWLLEFQNVSNIPLTGFNGRRSMRASQARDVLRGKTGKVQIYIVDFKLSLSNSPEIQPYAADMKRILDAAGSNLDVAKRPGGRWGLVTRVPQGVTLVLDDVLSKGDVASSLLRSAWDSCYRPSPSPAHGYYDAVRAVETLIKPLVLPNDHQAHLGRVAGHLRTHQDEWSFVLDGWRDESGVMHLVWCLRLLWDSQHGRHGLADALDEADTFENYREATIEEARAALLLAATVVGWLSQDALQRVATAN